jgi:hypothetical protein
VMRNRITFASFRNRPHANAIADRRRGHVRAARRPRLLRPYQELPIHRRRKRAFVVLGAARIFNRAVLQFLRSDGVTSSASTSLSRC